MMAARRKSKKDRAGSVIMRETQLKQIIIKPDRRIRHSAKCPEFTAEILRLR